MSVQVKLGHPGDVRCTTALPPKADVHPRSCYVAQVPRAAITTARIRAGAWQGSRGPYNALLVCGCNTALRGQRETSPPKFSASGNGRCRAAGSLAVGEGANLSLASDNHGSAGPGRRGDGHQRAPHRRGRAGVARTAGCDRERNRRIGQHRSRPWTRRARPACTSRPGRRCGRRRARRRTSSRNSTAQLSVR